MPSAAERERATSSHYTHEHADLCSCCCGFFCALLRRPSIGRRSWGARTGSMRIIVVGNPKIGARHSVLVIVGPLAACGREYITLPRRLQHR